MTDYTKTTDFTSKDSLPSGDSGKIIRGAEFGTEFDNIETAVNSKSNIDNPSFTGNITVTGTVDGRDIAADGTKLDTIETSADVTDTANVTAAGAVMDSELTDITAVKALNQGVATTDSPTFAAVTSTGNVTVGGTVDGRDVAADGTKLDTVETNADVTDTTNVTAAGALMDSEVTNLDQVKAFDSADYATAAQGTTADNALPKTGGAMTGAITTNSTFDGRDVATDGTKLDGIEALADVTDTTNVTAAGALMDSELTSEASVKALNQGVATTDSPTFAGATVNGTVEFDGLSGTGAVTVTDILDQDDMSGNSATALATQQSIKSYVDSQVATSDTLAEVLANGNTTGGTNVAFGDNDKAIFGAGSDLQIYHDGSNSYVKDAGTGQLILQGSTKVILKGVNGDNFLQGNEDGAVNLYHNDSQKLATSSTGIDVTGVITTDGMTTSADINFGDNDKAVFGAGSDLQIFHDGSRSYISDQGTGGVRILTNEFSIKSPDESESLFLSVQDGSTYLYNDNTIRLTTTSTGVDVTGTVTADGLTVDASTSSMITLNHSTPSNLTTIGQDSSGDFRVRSDNVNKLKSYANGDFELYEDTGTTAKFFWDASAESLGIGTSSPSSSYAVDATSGFRSSAAIPNFTLVETDASNQTWQINSTAAKLSFRDLSRAADRIVVDTAGNVGIGTSSPDANLEVIGNYRQKALDGNSQGFNLTINNTTDVVDLTNYYNAAMTFGTNDTERMRIDSNGTAMFKGGTTDNAIQIWESNSEIARIGGSSGTLNFLVGSTTESRMAINSSGNVGIGTSSPSNKLQIIGGTSGVDQINLASNLSDNTVKGAGIVMTMYTNNTAALIGGSAVNGATNLLFGSSGTDHRGIQNHIWYTNTNYNSTSGNTERMRIDSSGTLNLGTTLNVFGGADRYGYNFYANGQSNQSIDGTSDAVAQYINRENADGPFTKFYKDRVEVGSIGARGGDVYLETGDTGIRMYDQSDAIIPVGSAGVSRDAAIDLGLSNIRFKHLYLSGDLALTESFVFGNTDGLNLRANSGKVISMQIAGSEKARIDSSGNLLVGKTSTSINVSGLLIEADGKLRPSMTSDVAADFNRLSSDGAIIGFRKDGSTVGSIGSALGDSSVSTLFIADAGNVGIRFDQASTDDIQPCTSAGANRDDAINLGASGNRFKDLYLSGGVYLGGTAAANKLDDYEEGTWTPTLEASTTNPTGTVVVNNATYTKVGRMVHVQAYITVNVTNVGAGGAQITGLPFTIGTGYTSVKFSHGSLILSNGGYFNSGSTRIIAVTDHSTASIGYSGTGAGKALMISGTYEVA